MGRIQHWVVVQLSSFELSSFEPVPDNTFYPNGPVDTL